MIQLHGYHLHTLLYDGTTSVIYRGQRLSDQGPVILKTLKPETATAQDNARYRQEYNILHQINRQATTGVIQAYGVEEWQGYPVLVLEDFGGLSLAQIMVSRAQMPMAVAEGLAIALQLTEAIASIHTCGVIHKDITPANILIHPSTQVVKLIDFGIATVLSRETPTLSSPTVLEGTLAYLSPEQTGRMNRTLDYRTDFYSLGASLYELFTGQPPFQADDPMELVHCHLARTAPAIHHLNPKVPPIVSDIVAKLMAKTAEARYQSAWGLKADLVKCMEALDQGKTPEAIASFPLGQTDTADSFHIPQTLYGRDGERRQLMDAFERVATEGATELMQVAGYSGIGKSALVQELYQPITQARGYFIAGKFEQFQRNIPYAAIVEAFRGLVQQWLTEPEAALVRWRDRLQAAVGNNGQIIVDVIPEMEWIIGPQPRLPDLGASERRNRFSLVFQAVIQAVSTPNHPLVLFLDDVQWVDAATLKLLDLMLLDPHTRHLLVIAAYRDNEVDRTHPFTVAVTHWQQGGAIAHQLALQPLTLDHVTRLLADTLQSSTAAVADLSQLVWQKTRGNPFFINEFLQTLYADRLLWFDRHIQAWQWDVAQIKQQNITDNVVDLMVGKIQKLAPATQTALHIAACIGTDVPLATVAAVGQRSPQQTTEDLRPALDLGLLNPAAGRDDHLLIQHYRFGHDRIQQAAYSVMDEKTRQQMHFRIGTLLLKQAVAAADSAAADSATDTSSDTFAASSNAFESADAVSLSDAAAASERPLHSLTISPEQPLFAIVNQLNMGRPIVHSKAKRVELAQLNVRAGQKAKQAMAYEGAIAYFRTALSLLADSPSASPYDDDAAFTTTAPALWASHYDLVLQIHHELVSTTYSMGDFAAMTPSIQAVLEQGRSLLDQVPVYAIQVQAYLAQGQFEQAVNTAIQVSELLGVSVSTAPSESPVTHIDAIDAALGSRSPADLATLPTMTQAQAQAALQMLSSANSAAYVGMPAVLPAIVAKQVQLLMDHGNTSLSGFVYAWYGTLLCGGFSRIEQGYAFGQLALTLLERDEAAEIRPKTLFMVHCMIVPWRQHVRETLAPLLTAYREGRERGDVEFASWAILVRCEHLFCMGHGLDAVEAELQVASDSVKQFNQESALFHTRIFHQATLNLLGRSPHPHHLAGDRFDDAMLADFKQNQQEKTGLFHAYFCQLQLAYLFGHYDQAIACTIAVAPYLDAAAGLFVIAPYYLYDALAHLAIYADAPVVEQEKIQQRVRANLQQLQQWASHTPANHQHKADLVAAEWCRVQGQQPEAMAHYEESIAAARTHGYVNEEAIACELAAQFYLDWNKPTVAKAYALDALNAYQRWGAVAKVHQLITRYPDWLRPATAPKPSSQTSTITPTDGQSSGVSASLDVTTVLKVSQAISGEIVLENLLEKLMQFALENAGAERGLLLLVEDPSKSDTLRIEAMGTVDGVNASQSEPITPDVAMALSVVQYVQRTQTAVVLSDATADIRFSTDPYVVRSRPKSLLCSPILDRGQVRGLLYLENNLTTGAFTRDRLDLLTLISAQAAIALENAQLYRTLEDKVTERTVQLAEANDEITALNTRLQAENVRLSAELEITQRLQQMILPNPTELQGMGDLDIAGFMVPADEVGGDYYDVLGGDGVGDNPNQSVKIGIGDVTGHGLESGVLMLMVQTAVRTLQESQETDPVRFLDIVNRTLYKNIERMGTDKNLTLALLDYANGQLRLSGQHEELIVVRHGGQVERFDTIDLGFPIGLDTDISRFIGQTLVPLDVGDVAVLYTDGITEAENGDRVLYGIEQLCDRIRQHRHQSAAAIRHAVIEDVRAHIGTHTVFDDITLVVLKRLPQHE